MKMFVVIFVKLRSLSVPIFGHMTLFPHNTNDRLQPSDNIGSLQSYAVAETLTNSRILSH